MVDLSEDKFRDLSVFCIFSSTIIAIVEIPASIARYTKIPAFDAIGMSGMWYKNTKKLSSPRNDITPVFSFHFR
jgi:hypothetical protein